eukprot:Hpha_TRINITY_DN34426_c0_g1::TRINITY_DN34426_c0_g1_i1::g.96052::m.96052/K05838/ybbN; putative thioredoxin
MRTARVVARVAARRAVFAGVAHGAGAVAPRRHVPAGQHAAPQLRWCSGGAEASHPAVVDAVDERVINEVFTDRQTPILIDFRSAQAPPCKTYSPIIEQVVKDAYDAGKVCRLLRVDIDKSRVGTQLMQHFRVETLPTTFALWNGQLLDSLVGGAPQDVTQKFLDKFLEYAGVVQSKSEPEPDTDTPSDMSSKLVTARARAKQGKLDEAAQLYQECADTAIAAIAEEKAARKASAKPKKRDEKVELSTAQQTAPKALAALAGIHQMRGETQEAWQKLDKIRKEHGYALKQLHDVQNTIAQVELLLHTKYDHKPSAHYAEIVHSNPEPGVTLQLGAAMFMEGKQKEAVGLWLNVLKTHRKWGDDAAKKSLMAAFSLLGPKSEISIEGRKRMMAIIF